MAQIISFQLGPIQTNGYLVIDDEGSRQAIFIDPGGEMPELADLLEQRQWRLKYVLLTHAHFDHIGGVAGIVEATGASLAIHPLELPLLRAKGGATLFGLNIPPCPEPDILLEPGQLLEFGSLKFEVLLCRGTRWVTWLFTRRARTRSLVEMCSLRTALTNRHTVIFSASLPLDGQGPPDTANSAVRR